VYNHDISQGIGFIIFKPYGKKLSCAEIIVVHHLVLAFLDPDPCPVEEEIAVHHVVAAMTQCQMRIAVACKSVVPENILAGFVGNDLPIAVASGEVTILHQGAADKSALKTVADP
jgi:hypothetical protein